MRVREGERDEASLQRDRLYQSGVDGGWGEEMNRASDSAVLWFLPIMVFKHKVCLLALLFFQTYDYMILISYYSMTHRRLLAFSNIVSLYSKTDNQQHNTQFTFSSPFLSFNEIYCY